MPIPFYEPIAVTVAVPLNDPAAITSIGRMIMPEKNFIMAHPFRFADGQSCRPHMRQFLHPSR